MIRLSRDGACSANPRLARQARRLMPVMEPATQDPSTVLAPGASSERALGGLGSGGAYFGSPANGAVAGWMTVALTNTTGGVVDTLDLQYTGEQWRNGGNTATQTMTLEYGIGATFDAVTTWTAPGGTFNFTSLQNTATAAGLDGNAAANRTSGRGGTLSNLGWANNDTLWIRWVETNDAANDHGLAIDDFYATSPIVVNTTADENDGVGLGGVSLRDAITLANTLPGHNAIAFDLGVFGTQQTISIASQLPTISQALTISGPGANLLTIDAGDGTDTNFGTADGWRIFNIDNGVAGLIDVSISGLTLTGGDVTAGGAILNTENLTIRDSWIVANSGDFGGGILSSGTLSVVGSTISGNKAISGGGGINSSGTATILNSTISGNESPGATGGGIISYSPPAQTASLIVENSTITNNAASSGSAIHSFGAGSPVAKLNNSIINGQVLNTGSLAGGYNLFDGADPGITGSNNLFSTNAQLGPLSDNGGPTATHALLPGSPGIDAGQSPVAYYRFDETLGTSANDLIGGHSGVLNGGIVLGQSGPSQIGGTAATFDGVDDYVSVANAFSASQLSGDTYSVELWFNANNSTSEQSLFALTDNVGGHAVLMELHPGGILRFLNRIPAGNAGGNDLTTAAGTFKAGQWNHFAAVRDGINMRIYLNGIEVASLATASGNLPADLLLTMGRLSQVNPARPFGGKLDEAVLHNRALTRGEVALHASAGLVDQRGFPRVVDGNGDGTARVDIGAFEVTLPTNLVVDTNTDIVDGNYNSGQLSLREAIQIANLRPGAEMITFASTMSGETIELAGTELEITEALTIDASPLATNVTIDANLQSRIVNITATSGNFTLSGLTFTNGRTTGNNSDNSDSTFSGGAIRSRSSLTLYESTVTGSSTTGNFAKGGGIWTNNLTLTLSTVSGNNTLGYRAYGGGISANSLTLTQSTVSGNTTTGSNAVGGGIFASGATLTQSTVSGNKTTGSYADGGGIHSFGSVNLTQSTISGNSTATSYADGGGIYASEVTLTNSTITGNQVTGSGSLGGGVYLRNLSGTRPLSMSGTIVAGNTAASGIHDLKADLQSVINCNYTVIGATSGSGVTALTGTGNILNVNPLLGPLADNGGPTQTHALLLGSPAVDAGDPAIVSGVDQRGFTRVVDGNGNGVARIDIGAYETTSLSITVDTNSDIVDGDYSTGQLSLREAIGLTNARPGADAIFFAPGLSGSTITLGGTELEITDELAIDAAPLATNVTIDANLQSRIFNITAAAGDFTLAGLTLTRGRTTGNSEFGGAVRSATSGMLTITDCTVTGNSTQGDVSPGGGIFATSILTVSQSTVSNNSTLGESSYGGGILAFTTLLISDSTVSGNRTEGIGSLGGGIAANDLTMSECIVSNNETTGNTSNGGGVWTTNATITQSTLLNNRTTGDHAHGGGIQASQLELSESTVSGNSTAGVSSSGGGIFAVSLSVMQGIVSGNSTLGDESEGGGIYAVAASTISNSTLTGNSTHGGSSYGGGIQALDSLVISHSSVSGNSTLGTESVGGGISASNLLLVESIVSNNETGGNSAIGGGIWGFVVTIDQSTVSNNKTTGSSGRGGGISAALLTITKSTVSGNSATGSNSRGGGLYGATLTLTGSTISGNSVTGTNSDGGGIYTHVATITDSTVTANQSSGSGGGIYQSDFGNDSPLTITRTILAGNTAASGVHDLLPDPQSVVAVNYSLIGNTSGSGITISTGSGNLLNVDPLLGPLANNGGPTQTHALLPGSPALDAGLTGEVIDDFADNDFATNYNFFNVYNVPTNAPSVSGGLAHVNVGNGAAAHIWNQGQKLQNVGDLVSVDLGFNYPLDNPNNNVNGSAGLALFSEVGGGTLLSEVRVNIDINGTGSIFNLEDDAPGVGTTNIVGTPTGLMHLQIRVTGTTPTTITIESTLSGPGITTVVKTRTLNVTEAYFGLAGFNVVGNDSVHDNLAFYAAGSAVDQRGLPRVASGGTSFRQDIGAYESQIDPSADFDGDGDVDGRDFLAWQRGYDKPNAVRPDGNSDDDLDVDASDLAAWQVSYGVVPVPVGAVSSLFAGGAESTAFETGPDAALASLFVGLSNNVGLSNYAARGDVEKESNVDMLSIEEVDRAFEQLAATSTSVNSFGEMVTRRGVAKRVALESVGSALD